MLYVDTNFLGHGNASGSILLKEQNTLAMCDYNMRQLKNVQGFKAFQN